jgi:hypothetical protein
MSHTELGALIAADADAPATCVSSAVAATSAGFGSGEGWQGGVDDRQWPPVQVHGSAVLSRLHVSASELSRRGWAELGSVADCRNASTRQRCATYKLPLSPHTHSRCSFSLPRQPPPLLSCPSTTHSLAQLCSPRYFALILGTRPISTGTALFSALTLQYQHRAVGESSARRDEGLGSSVLPTTARNLFFSRLSRPLSFYPSIRLARSHLSS